MLSIKVISGTPPLSMALSMVSSIARLVRRNGLLLLLAGRLQGIGPGLLRIRAARRDEHDHKHEADVGGHSCSQ